MAFFAAALAPGANSTNTRDFSAATRVEVNARQKKVMAAVLIKWRVAFIILLEPRTMRGQMNPQVMPKPVHSRIGTSPRAKTISQSIRKIDLRRFVLRLLFPVNTRFMSEPFVCTALRRQ